VPGRRSSTRSRGESAERFERKEAARRAAEDRCRQEAATARKGLSLDDLKRRRDELQASILERQTHVRVQAQEELRRQRAERLRRDIETLEAKRAALEAELRAVAQR
jgi:hypothetical protein